QYLLHVVALRSVGFVVLLFFFYYYRDHRDLHSFPTRRSSDLGGPRGRTGRRAPRRRAPRGRRGRGPGGNGGERTRQRTLGGRPGIVRETVPPSHPVAQGFSGGPWTMDHGPWTTLAADGRSFLIPQSPIPDPQPDA